MRLFDFQADPTIVANSLSDRYVVPPFSVLDTRQDYWQKRRNQWLALGLKPEIGRNGGLAFGRFDGDGFAHVDAASTHNNGTSIFDPVLAEIACRWFAPARGVVLDPFAGGSVRGIVAAALGYKYVGIELRGEQVTSNRQQAEDILHTEDHAQRVRWAQADAAAALMPRADLVFTCPPYGDLEVYSDDPRDLSNMSEGDFERAYRKIAERAIEALRRDRFAVVVVGNTRARDGRLRDLVGLTVDAFSRAGATYYNEGVLVGRVGSGALRAPKQFDVSRKLVRMHQSVLVFVKGDPKVAANNVNGGRHEHQQAA